MNCSSGLGSIIVIIADAWSQTMFHELLDGAQLPEIQHEIVNRSAVYDKVVSCFPSVSLASHATLLTGTSQCEHRIPGHRWLDQQQNLVRNYIGLGISHVNADLSKSVKTIYERFQDTESFSINDPISRGADHSLRFPSLRSSSILRKTARLVRSFPRSLFVVWLPRGDIVSHIHGPFSQELADEMKDTSHGIGILSDTLRRSKLLERAQVIFVADHGQREVKHKADLRDALRSVGLRSVVNPYLRSAEDVMALTSGDSAAYLYFRDSQLNSEDKLKILARLSKYEGIGLVFFQYSEDRHYVISRIGGGIIDVSSDGHVRYANAFGKDPLGILEECGSCDFLPGTGPRVREMDRYPDIIHQYLASFVPGRSSKTLVTAERGFHFGKAPRIGWRFGYHRGSHGGPLREEMLVTGMYTSRDPRISHVPVRSRDFLGLALEEGGWEIT